MPITGTFDVISFTDVLKLLAGKQLTGRLHVRSRTIGANLYLEEGLLVGADVGEHHPTSPTDVRSRMEEICFELLDAERGTFEFLPETRIAAQYPISVRIDTVLDQARRRLHKWREIRTVIPSLDLHPRIVNDIDQDEVTLTRDRWRLMTVVDGRRSVRAIARTLGVSDYEACRMIKSLVDEGMAVIDPPHRAVVSQRRTPPVFVDDSAVQAEAELDAVARQAASGSNGSPAPATPRESQSPTASGSSELPADGTSTPDEATAIPPPVAVWQTVAAGEAPPASDQAFPGPPATPGGPPALIALPSVTPPPIGQPMVAHQESVEATVSGQPDQPRRNGRLRRSRSHPPATPAEPAE